MKIVLETRRWKNGNFCAKTRILQQQIILLVFSPKWYFFSASQNVRIRLKSVTFMSFQTLSLILFRQSQISKIFLLPRNFSLKSHKCLFSAFFCFAFWNANMNSIKCHLTFKTSQGMTRNERKSCIFPFVQKNALFCCRLEQKPSKIAQLKSPWMKKKMGILIKINWMIEDYVVLGSICTRIKFFLC